MFDFELVNFVDFFWWGGFFLRGGGSYFKLYLNGLGSIIVLAYKKSISNKVT